jgi:uncharacterized protein (TIGR03437 family)
MLAESPRGAGTTMATELKQTRVWFDEVAAPLLYSVKGEICAVVPYEVHGKPTTRVEVEYKGTRSPAILLPVADAVPGLFTLDSTGKGQAAILNETGCCNSPRNPAARGSVVSLYVTGEGQTVPAGITGNVSSYERTDEYPKPRGHVRVTVGGVPAEIVFIGESPDSVAGQLLLNIRIPRKAPVGDAIPLVITVGDTRSPDGVTMAVRSEVRTVLILDPADRAWLRPVLAKAGFEVLSTPDPKHPADLIISSIRMQAAAALAEMRALRPQVKLMIVAPALTPDVLKSADLLGAQGVLAKFWPASTVAANVRELLRPKLAVYNTSDVPKLAPRTLPLYR